MSWSAEMVHVLGWTAATLTLMGFFSRDFCRLRCLALGANLNFIAYGWLADLGPVLALHLLLLPLNLWRLYELRRSQANSVNGA